MKKITNDNKLQKPKINKYLSFTISNDKSLLDILDSVEELKDVKDIRDSKENINKKCRSCNKVIMNKLGDHQIICFQTLVKELNIEIEELKNEMKTLKQELTKKIQHEIHIKGLELLIERNNKKWNKIMKGK